MGRTGTAVECLDLRLLIHAQHDRVLRRSQVEPADVGDLPDQLGVDGEPERLRYPRLDPVGPPRTRDRGVAGPQPVGEQPGRPVRHAELLRRRLQGLGHDLAVVQLTRSTRARCIREARNPALLVPATPTQHRGSPSRQSAPRAACSRRHQRPATRSAPASQPTLRTGQSESSARASSRSPSRRTSAGAGRFAMPHDFRSRTL
jgi:hypothetical protein